MHHKPEEISSKLKQKQLQGAQNVYVFWLIIKMFALMAGKHHLRWVHLRKLSIMQTTTALKMQLYSDCIVRNGFNISLSLHLIAPFKCQSVKWPGHQNVFVYVIRIPPAKSAQTPGCFGLFDTVGR